MTAFSASRSALKAAAAAGRCHLSTVAVPKKSQNIVHLDRFMTRADLLLKNQQNATATASTETVTVTKNSTQPLLRGATDAQITVGAGH